MKTIAPYGSWDSPISPEMVASTSVGLSEPMYDRRGQLHWVETHPSDEGRSVLVRRREDRTRRDPEVLTLPGQSLQNNLYGYDSSPVCLVDNGYVFTNFDKNAPMSDQRLLLHHQSRSPHPLTAEMGMILHGMPVYDPVRNRVVAVRETKVQGKVDQHTVIGVDLAVGNSQQTLVDGPDFVCWPQVSPTGDRLAVVTWKKGDMPWDETQLWELSLRADGATGEPVHVAGHWGESVVFPKYSFNGKLHFMSNRTGFWNLYRRDKDGITPVIRMDADMCGAPWPATSYSYGFAAQDQIVAGYIRDARWNLVRHNAHTGRTIPLDLPYTHIREMAVFRHKLALVGSGTKQFNHLAEIDLRSKQADVLRKCTDLNISAADIPEPEHVCFPTTGGGKAYGIIYRPTNSKWKAPADELPPFLMIVHGGPTAGDTQSLYMTVLFYTSRGYTVGLLNYRGSTGYGRDYMQSLKGNWGVYDTEDAAAFIEYLVRRGLIDPKRVIISGASAGGFVALNMAADRPDLVAGVVSVAGVTDLRLLTKWTHKLEDTYTAQMAGPESGWAKRSPMQKIAQICCPVMIFQGGRDRVVPPAQAVKMVRILREQKRQVAFRLYKDGLHGWTEGEYRIDELKTTLAFMNQVCNVHSSEDLPPIPWV